MKTLLVVSYSRSGGTEAMTNAVLQGAGDEAIDGVRVIAKSALETSVQDVLDCAGIVLGTPENFGYMSGAMKFFFETIYHPCLEHSQGLPYALFVRAGNDGAGAVTSVERIVAGLKWRSVQPPLIAVGELSPDVLDQCRDLGLTIAAGLEAGIY